VSVERIITGQLVNSPMALQQGWKMEGKDLVDAWRSIINGPEKSWVLFAQGTCVILMEPQGDLAAQATALLREWGPVHPGSSSGDFSTITLEDGKGWVGGHLPPQRHPQLRRAR
jgi:hypothetical protein